MLKLRIVEIRPEIADAVARCGGYCPCSLTVGEDTRCPCKVFREMDTPGECHCGRYRKEEAECASQE